ncbi:hypothetical protein Tco_0136034, partial [Tanacetum coccineum]
MGIREIPKFCDLTFKIVVKQVSAIVCVARFGFKEPPLSELDRDVMELFETD